MIRFHTYGPLPRSMSSTQCLFLTTRKTMFGVHRNLHRIDFDDECSKTALLGFVEQDNAELFLKKIDHMQRSGSNVDRCMIGDIMPPNSYLPWRSGIAPLKLEPFPINDIQRLCLLHYFDLYIVVNIDAGLPSDSSKSSHESDMTLLCYEFKTYEWPNRNILDRFMSDMYRDDI